MGRAALKVDGLVYSGAVNFEVELYKNETGEWVATAVEHDVTAKGRTENEALSLLMDALAVYFKKS